MRRVGRLLTGLMDSPARGYEAPDSVEQAVALLSAHGPAARPLAGGSDLLVQLRAGLQKPAVIVDLKRIPELSAVVLDDEVLRIGAARSSAALREEPSYRALFPGLLEACELIGSEQIQGRASIGGNLCNASPAADTVPALLVNEARCEIAGPEGRRFVPATEFCTGPGSTVLGLGELLVALHISRPAARSADAFLRFTPRSEMDIAVVSAAARVQLGEDGRCLDARLALGAVGPTAFIAEQAGDALRGVSPDDAALERVAALAREAAAPIDDKRGSIAYRRQVAGVLAKRALRVALARAAERTRG